MEKFTIYTGTTVPLMNDNIDTDQILPKQFLKLIDKKGFGKYLMYSKSYYKKNARRYPPTKTTKGWITDEYEKVLGNGR